MALKQLTDEQTLAWTREQKDRWWLENIYRGDVPQLTVRSALTGFCLGGILSAAALYICGKTGITVGVGLTSVIVAFAAFRGMSRTGISRDFTILENNCTQSIATAAGYMITQLMASMTAYMLVTGQVIPWWQMMTWNAATSVLGVLLAFPLKRRFINEDQLPFPEGRACGVVLDALYTGGAKEGMFQARLLFLTAGGAGLYQFFTGEGWMKLLQFKLLRLDKWLGWDEPWHFYQRIDEYYYMLATKFSLWIPKIGGVDIRALGLRATLEVAMLGVGGLMGIRVATSVALGAFVNYAVLAPIMIDLGDIAPRLAPDGSTVPISRIEILNQWSLWWGVTMMVVGAMVSLFAKPEMITGAFTKLFAKRKEGGDGTDVLRHIELPLWLSFVGVPIMSFVCVALTHWYFAVPWHLALLALPLIFVLVIICTNSMALTSWTPTSALAKITQFTIGAVDRTNPATNLMTGGMTAEIAANAGNLLSDIKPGYMLGAKPRQQAIGHCIGIVAGALASTPLFFLLFLPPDAAGVRTTATIVTDNFPMPSAMQWKGVSDLISGGLKGLPTSALISMAIAAVAALVFEVARIKTKNRFPLSAVSIGLGVILPPEYCFTMWVGALGFWWMARKKPAPGTNAHRIWVEGAEPICAGLISGAALVGIGDAIVTAVLG